MRAIGWLGLVMLVGACNREPTIVVKFEPVDMAGKPSARAVDASAPRDMATAVDASIRLDPNSTSMVKPECAKDQDCVAVPDGCCSCNQGGKLRAASKSTAKKLEAECRRAKPMCTMMMSDDPSCAKVPACLAGRCTLK